jgi:hypothetical protein
LGIIDNLLGDTITSWGLAALQCFDGFAQFLDGGFCVKFSQFKKQKKKAKQSNLGMPLLLNAIPCTVQ